MRALSPVHSTPSRGLFLDSCHAHCQGGSADSWSGDKGPQVANTVINLCILKVLQFHLDFAFSLDCNFVYFAENCESSGKLVLWSECIPEDRLSIADL